MATAWTRLPFRKPCYVPRFLRLNRLIPDLTSSFRSISDLRSNSSVINAALKIEEERLSTYSQNDHFPLQPGDKSKSRYRVLGKLGYGASSTVWLVRDLEYTSESSPAFRVVAQLQQVTPLCCTQSLHPKSNADEQRARDIPTLEHSQQVSCWSTVCAHDS